ncbi:hypothetical protein EMCRGX_G004999 [Ephydatia muelleri]|eukprot:Em0053g20a
MFRPQIAEHPILGMKILDSAGIYTGDEDASDQDLLVVERKTFKSLCSGLVQQCGCLSNPSWTIASFVKTVTCAGMLPRQYMNFALFAGMGVVKQKYISSVYLNQFYQQVVADVAEESMKAAVERVKESPHHATSGEHIVHFSTHRIVGISTLSRQQHRVAQTREVACTKIVLPQVIARGLNITEVAHDYQATIKLYVRQLGMVNSYDTWHGTKNVAKQLRHICADTVCTRDRTWFTELSDKARLRSTKEPLTMPAAINAYEAALRKTVIYKNADSCHLCRDTYWVESFNHQLLTYLPKRIHFHTKTFEMRMNLAVMDWDEDDDDDMVLPDDAAMYDGDYVDSEDDDYVCSEDGGDDEEEDN